MRGTRVIPCLLLKGRQLVKTVKFSQPKYVGDPINAVRIFNEKEVDELVLLDISATVEDRSPDLKLIAEIAGECFMPLCYGGGVRTLESVKEILNVGAEKVCLNTSAIEHPTFVTAAAEAVGSQSVVVSIDTKRTGEGRYEVFTHGGRRPSGREAVTWAVQVEALGAGELFLNSIDRDGTMQGYDLELVRRVTEAVHIPVIACGGAGRIQDLVDAVRGAGASAVAAGSLFVFYGKHRAVLINYPTSDELSAGFA